MQDEKPIIDKCISSLKTGGVVLSPTDTVPGLLCDPRSADAISKIIKIKDRSESKSFIITLSSEEKLHHFVKDVPELAYELVEHSTIPLTIIYSGAIGLPASVVADDGTVAIRIVKHGFYSRLLQKWNFALVSTSANKGGEKTPHRMEDVSSVILDAVDYAVNLPETKTESIKPSRIIKLDPDGKIRIIRQ